MSTTMPLLRRSPVRVACAGRASLFGALLFVGGACTEQTPTPGAPTTIGTDARRTADGLELQIQPSTFRAGDTVLVSVRLPMTMAAGEVGAFTLQLQYDREQLRHMGDAPSTLQHMANLRDDGLQVAGASATGFASRELARERFVATRDGSATNVTITLRELTTPDLRDLRNALRTR